MDDWAKIRQLFSTGQHSKREIGRLVGVSRRTVDRALEADRLPKYQRSPSGSSFDLFAVRVRALLALTPTIPASTLADRVGWSGSASVFRDKVAAIRPEYVPPDPADRLVHEPGRQVQCDLWFPHEPLPLGRGQEGMPPVLVMTASFSGFIQARMLPSRTTPDLLGGMWSLLQDAKAVPGRLLWDNDDHRAPNQDPNPCSKATAASGPGPPDRSAQRAFRSSSAPHPGEARADTPPRCPAVPSGRNAARSAHGLPRARPPNPAPQPHKYHRPAPRINTGPHRKQRTTPTNLK